MSLSLTSATSYYFLSDPDSLCVPTDFYCRPLPTLIEPSHLPKVIAPSLHDADPLIAVDSNQVKVLSHYWNEGYTNSYKTAFVRSSVATRLYAAVKALPIGFGLAVFDAYRDLDLQTKIYEKVYADPSVPHGFVSQPSTNPSTPPPHLTGGAVDVTLTYQDCPLALGSNFDEFTDLAHASAYEKTPGKIRKLRRLLFWTMHDQGFRVLNCEWWHFEIGTPRWSAITEKEPWYGPTHVEDPS